MEIKSEHEQLEELNRDELVNKLKQEAILTNYGRLLTVLINLYVEKRFLDKLDKREGQEIQLNFPQYEIEKNSLTFVLSKTPPDPKLGPSENPKAIITFKVKNEKLIPTLVDIVRTKYNLFGLLKLIFKYLLTGKVRFKPKRAIGAVMGMMKLFLIGKHDVFKPPNQEVEM